MIKRFLRGFFPGEIKDFKRGHKFKVEDKRYMFTWLAESIWHLVLLLSIVVTTKEENMKYPDFEKDEKLTKQANDIVKRWNL